ncbi:branched-chain alpha-ketoacid dehydrogenase, partial [Gilbertella persicaria]|uniref:branched-chain alpha-ketoacid dehydrogenase n=1 Tax=Gilbertella persicaria TaxID=101096 RepID=UPI0022210C3F
MKNTFTKRLYSTVAAYAQPQHHQHFYLNKTLDHYYSQNPTPLTLRQLIFYERHCNTERLLKSANYVRTELPIRIAHRIREFQKLPYILGTNPHIEAVYDLYWQAFERIRQVPVIQTREENEAFCDLLQQSLDAHLVVIPQLAKGIHECEQQYEGIMSMDRLDRFMNSTLRSRISRRVITEHHLVLSKRKKSIFNLCSSHNVLTKCIHLAQAHALYLQKQEGGHTVLPKIQLNGSDTEFMYVSDHIEYILFQLLSNAFRHSMAHQPKEIKVTLCSNPTDVLFRISDQGGGMSKQMFRHLWSYGHGRRFGNMDKVQELEAKLNEHEKMIMRLGIGLPMSRVYAEYWGGDINLVTMEGYGTDAYVRIPRLGTTSENLGDPLDEVIM